MKDFQHKLLNLIDYRFYTGIALIWLIIKLTPGFIPDFLNLKYLLENNDVISVLLTITTSLFGILIAFLLLAFGIFRDKFGRVALSFLVKERNLIILINLLLSVTIHLLFSYVIINNKAVITDFSLTIAYFSIFIFILSLFLLFPISFGALYAPDSLKNIKDCISKVTIEEINKLNNGKEKNDTDFAISIDENPISVVQRYGLSLIKSEDKLGFGLLLIKYNDSIIEIIGTDPSRDQIGVNYKTFLGSLSVFISELVTQKDEKTLKNIWVIIRLNHKYFADKNIQLLYLEELDFFTKNFIDICLDNQLDNVTNFGLLQIERILKYHYDNSLPPQENISMLMDVFENKAIEYNMDADIQWDKISQDFPYYFTIILRKSIESNNLNIFTSTLYHLDLLVSEVLRNEMGEYQKAAVIFDLVSDLYYYQLEALKKNLFQSCREVKQLSTRTCNKAIEENALFKKRLLSTVVDFHIELLRIKKLDFSLMFPNYFGAIGRTCSNKYHESESFAETLEYILRVLKFFKKEFEKDLKNNQHNYSIIKSEIESFVKFHKRSTNYMTDADKSDDLVDKKLLLNLKELLGSFKDVDKSDLKFGQNIIEWK